MKSFSSMKWIGFFALAAVAYAVQDPLLLRRELKPGTTETYKIDSVVKQNVEIPSVGEQDLVITSVATCEVKIADLDAKGNANVETLTKYEKLLTEGSIAAMMGNTEQKLPEPKKEKGTLDNRNNLVLAKPAATTKPATDSGVAGMFPALEAANSAQSLLAFVVLPEKAVKVGETWDVPLPASVTSAASGVKDIKMSAKFMGEKVVDQRPVYVFATTGSFKMDMDSSKLPNPGGAGELSMSGTGAITGEGLVDKATGRTVSHTLNIKNDMKLSVQSMGEMPVRGTVTITLKLQK